MEEWKELSFLILPYLDDAVSSCIRMTDFIPYGNLNKHYFANLFESLGKKKLKNN